MREPGSRHFRLSLSLLVSQKKFAVSSVRMFGGFLGVLLAAI
jgi:hypothetical protein